MAAPESGRPRTARSVGQEELDAAGALPAVDPEPEPELEPEPEPEPDDDPEEDDEDESDDPEEDDGDDSDLAGLLAAPVPFSDPDVRESVR
ncbi:hypothetical protein AB0K27_19360 [Micromonospora echinospora]|uniref:Uncharacterized protein n=1 Tax=Micromonospora echinospora TaxID=1877 RepID=A0ABR6M7U0_MICEC|nr:hypothetical protein [Micromonospora echinospora]MBB5111449.1 hypothetical protein [Micromonospora echinospora]